MVKIVIGSWRENEKNDPVQVVSGPTAKEKVHYHALGSELLATEI
jgi:hypothetical protein